MKKMFCALPTGLLQPTGCVRCQHGDRGGCGSSGALGTRVLLCCAVVLHDARAHATAAVVRQRAQRALTNAARCAVR